MTTGGWIFLSISLVFVWGLVSWCFWRVMATNSEIPEPPDSLGG